AAFTHKEAMRYGLAARVVFGPLQRHNPFQLNLFDNLGRLIDSVTVSSITVDVRNVPYARDDGKDIEAAWAKVELFDLNSKPVLEPWTYPRWEDNNQPGYGGNPRDHFPTKENFRTLSANRSFNRITIAVKPLLEAEAYRLRGEDQITGWIRDKNNIIPPGEYL